MHPPRPPRSLIKCSNADFPAAAGPLGSSSSPSAHGDDASLPPPPPPCFPLSSPAAAEVISGGGGAHPSAAGVSCWSAAMHADSRVGLEGECLMVAMVAGTVGGKPRVVVVASSSKVGFSSSKPAAGPLTEGGSEAAEGAATKEASRGASESSVAGDVCGRAVERYRLPADSQSPPSPSPP